MKYDRNCLLGGDLYSSDELAELEHLGVAAITINHLHPSSEGDGRCIVIETRIDHGAKRVIRTARWDEAL